MKQLVVIELLDVMAVCLDTDDEKHYILASDMPPGVVEGTCLYIDDTGDIWIDQVNTRRNK